MKTVFEHIEHVRGKPHHIRKRVAFTAAGGITALVALVWLASSLGTGVFAIKGSSFAESAAQSSGLMIKGAAQPETGLAGAAAALPSADAPARIEIVDVAPSSSPAKQHEQTTLPF
ncbi:hypothetical protein HY972_01400 [Candidatus Kaiserbacteria bacterium]|nr:hypothetical protein [Candidatus Kaiserbacteria bacterium]